MSETSGLAARAATIGLTCLLAACSGRAHAESLEGAEEPGSTPARAAGGAPSSARDEPPPPAAPRALAASCPEGMALVRGGTLAHLEHAPDTTVGDVCLDSREVSVASFRACVERGACLRECPDPSDCPAVPARTDWGNRQEDDDISRLCNGRRQDAEDHPVNCVSPAEARAYCAAEGKRLPSGDEWEWAARKARGTPWGSPVATDEICWGRPKKRAGTCARGAHPRDVTPEGVLDLGGNVTEWTEAPARAPGGRFAYGASWYARDDGYVSAALGGVGMPARRAETVGFRCAASPTPDGSGSR